MEETERGNWEAAAYLKERAEPAASGSPLLTTRSFLASFLNILVLMKIPELKSQMRCILAMEHPVEQVLVISTEKVCVPSGCIPTWPCAIAMSFFEHWSASPVIVVPAYIKTLRN